MKYVYLIMLLIFSNTLLICDPNTDLKNTVNSNNQDIEKEAKQKAEQLKRSYQKLASSPLTEEYQLEYFEQFPNTFLLLNKLFGYSLNEPYRDTPDNFISPLHDEADLYIEVFFKLNVIEKNYISIV
jgi:hypothetical protein